MNNPGYGEGNSLLIIIVRPGQQVFRRLSKEDAIRDRDWLDDAVPNFIQVFKECFDTVELTQLKSALVL